MKAMNLNFMGKRKIFYTISLLIMVIGIIFNIAFGTTLDIQFSGGTIISYSYTGSLEEKAIENVIEGAIGEQINTTRGVDSQTGRETITITLVASKALPAPVQNSMLEAVQKAFPDNDLQLRSTTSVDASVGKDFFAKGIAAVVLASLFMILYVGIRFRKIGGLSAGCMAVVALLHDVLVAYFTFVIFRIPINDNFIAVVLTIFGYSLNATIVIYDRIRENNNLYKGKLGYGELVNKSINQTFARCLNTALCTFVAVICIVVVALVFQLNSIISFALPMAFGIVSGCYSSICLATTLWGTYKESRGKKASRRKI